MKNKIAQWIAHRLPKRVLYFAYIRAMAYGWSATNKTPNEITFDEVCNLLTPSK